MRLTGLESNSSSSSPKGEVCSTSSNQEPSQNQSKSMGKLSIPSLSSPSSPTKNSPKTPQLQSINYYESYFDDSYVGDFSGDVPSDAQLDSDEVDQDWPNISEINSTSGVIEFAYDSFGPESIVFPNGSEDSTLPVETINGTVGEKVEDKPSEHDEQENSPGKLEVNDVCDDVLPNTANFVRNSTLTISQRKKLSPQINFSDIMNTSDDVTPSPAVNEDVGVNEFTTNDQNLNEHKISLHPDSSKIEG